MASRELPTGCDTLCPMSLTILTRKTTATSSRQMNVREIETSTIAVVLPATVFVFKLAMFSDTLPVLYWLE